MGNKSKAFVDFFPSPADPNPFFFKSKDCYVKASELLDKLSQAEDEWEDKVKKKETPSENDIKRWGQLLAEYEESLKNGLQDKFKSEKG